MGALNLLDLFAEIVGVFDLVLKARDVHPVMLYDAFDEFLLTGVLPEKLGICPFVLCAVFGHLCADFVQIVVDLH